MKNDIINYYEYDSNLSSGGQPTPEQLEALAKDRVEAIVNLSPASTRNYLKDEAAIVEKLGLDYVHFPVDCSKLTQVHYDMFSSIMQGLAGRKVFVHCGGNIKSSNLLHMFKVLKEKQPEEQSLSTLKKIQQPEEKWFSFFKANGMQGLK